MTHVDTKRNIQQARADLGRVAAATMAVAGAVVVSALGPVSLANANADLYVALAYSWQSSVPGLATKQPDSETAMRAALLNCQDDNRGNQCIWYGSFKNECAALAIDGMRDWATGTGPDIRTAEQRALQQNPGGRIAVSGCASGSNSIPVNPKTTLPRAPLAPAQQ